MQHYVQLHKCNVSGSNWHVHSKNGLAFIEFYFERRALAEWRGFAFFKVAWQDVASLLALLLVERC